MSPTREHPPDRNGLAALGIHAPEDQTPQYDPALPKPASALSEQELREKEPDLLEYLFRSDKRSKAFYAPVELRRLEVPQKDADGNWLRDDQGAPVLGPLVLHVRAIYQRELDEITRRTRTRKERDDRGRLVQVKDPVEANCRMIEMALLEEDRALLNEKRMRDEYHAGDVLGVIANLLTAGEVSRIVNFVLRMSNLQQELSPEDEALLGEASGEAEQPSPA